MAIIKNWVQSLLEPFWLRFADRFPDIFLKFLLTWMGYLVVRMMLRFVIQSIIQPIVERGRLSEYQRRFRLVTLEAIAQSALKYAFYFMLLSLLLSAFGQNTSSIIATAGVAGVAIGFGSQKFVRDVVTGFLLLMEDQFDVGDVVSISGNIGTIEETGMRITKLRDDNGRLIILSNGDITNVINLSKGGYKIGIDLAVARETKPETMKEVVEKTAEMIAPVEAEEMKPVFESDEMKPALKGITGFTAASVTYRVEMIAPAAKRLEAETELRAALLKCLEEKDVKIA